MSNIKCIVIEDEPLAVKVLSDYVSAGSSFLEMQKYFTKMPFLQLTTFAIIVPTLFFRYPFTQAKRDGF